MPKGEEWLIVNQSALSGVLGLRILDCIGDVGELRDRECIRCESTTGQTAGEPEHGRYVVIQ